MLKYLFFILLSIFCLGFARGGSLVINEFMAANNGAVSDPDYNESSDWIELYNAGTVDVDLGGYRLSDKVSDSLKWFIPVNTTIRAGGFLLIWADGMNQGLHTSYKLSAAGEELALFSPAGTIIDSISFGPQESDVSRGRIADGAEQWGFFIAPTPGASNISSSFEGLVLNRPQFSPAGAIYQQKQLVSLSNTFGGNIRYTTNGSEPTEQSTLYTQPIEISSTTVLRARIFRDNEVPGEIISHTYFIDTDDSMGELPVVSLVSDPDNFWHPGKGIYVQDFKPEWEVPLNIEFFENDGSDRAAFNEKAGTKVNGLYSWQLPQKMLGIYFRKAYGKGKLDFPLFFDRERSTFDSFALRASGSDWSYTLFRDGLAQLLTAMNMEVDYQGFRPCVVYVNGEYMGIHNIRSKVDKDFVVENHQLGDTPVDMIEYEEYVEEGSIDAYAAFERLYHNDLSVQANYDAVAEQMDIENFTDFIITEIYVRNTSVDHNVMAWKPREGGKWKWILMDLDRGFFKPTENKIDYYAERNVTPFNYLLQNEGYRKYFGRRLSDHLLTTFAPERVKSEVDRFKKNIANEIPRHITRWEGTTSNYGDAIPSTDYWTEQVDALKLFAGVRPSVLLADLEAYGFEQAIPLSLTSIPANAGQLCLNGLNVLTSTVAGAYPGSEHIALEAKALAGYRFKGWAEGSMLSFIEAESTWKYYDRETLPASNWADPSFDDSNWSQGQAELGYGDGDENTEVSFGGDSNNKYITTWFRKSFQAESKNLTGLLLQLKCDDGAVVYLNGKELLRKNMPQGAVDADTRALVAIGGSSEDEFTLYHLGTDGLIEGSNVLAIEVHQAGGSSSDISFDLSLSAVQQNEAIVESKQSFSFSHVDEKHLIALFESDGSCQVPDTIDQEMVLSKACSPYKVPADVWITPTGKLILEAGVELHFSDGVAITINGAMDVRGEEEAPVVMMSDPESELQRWGFLNFVNADTSRLNRLIIENASKGLHPLRECAAIAAFNSLLYIDGLTIEKVHANPIMARYSDIRLTNSKLHSAITGDLINVKYGKALIDGCDFTGNNMPDTDAIDYDDVRDGVIRNCIIRDFHGFNSDAIDIGEQSKNVRIENVLAYNITDKGVSLGQQSTAHIISSLFVNCNLGVAIKDSGHVIIDQCTFYATGTPVASYEKNPGDAGGNAVVMNSILSNSYDQSWLADQYSTIDITYSLLDNDALPADQNNLLADPLFVGPNVFDFQLQAASPARGAGTDGNMGAHGNWKVEAAMPVISSLLYDPVLTAGNIELVSLTNPGEEDIDLSGFRFTRGVTFTFPEGTILEPGRSLYLSDNATSPFWLEKTARVFQWESGRLANEGEQIRLESPGGIVADQLNYLSSAPWPALNKEEGIELVNSALDNHFGKNWKTVNVGLMVGREVINQTATMTFYPNPTRGAVYFDRQDFEGKIRIFNVTGELVRTIAVDDKLGKFSMDELPNGVYLLQTTVGSQRILLMH